jgi:hypothetical protein
MVIFEISSHRKANWRAARIPKAAALKAAALRLNLPQTLGAPAARAAMRRGECERASCGIVGR